MDAINKLNDDGKKIRAALMLLGIKQVDICRGLKVSRSAVSQVISGNARSSRIRSSVAQALGVTVKELWPDNGHKKVA